MLPVEVLEASAKALMDFQGKGFGIAECSHRGKEFDGVLDEAIAKCRSLLDIPESHAEIADMLGIPQHTVRDRARSALDALADGPSETHRSAREPVPDVGWRAGSTGAPSSVPPAPVPACSPAAPAAVWKPPRAPGAPTRAATSGSSR